MSTYYQKKDVKLMIARQLRELGWTILGYYYATYDPWSDYQDTDYWGGVATKNGYVFCVDVSRERTKEEYVYEYASVSNKENSEIIKKINKLENMTVERGASEAEEKSAKKSIEKLREKITESNELERVIKETIPKHLANPPRSNWHLEKDGVIILKGQGLLKFSELYAEYMYEHHRTVMKEYRADPVKYEKTEYETLLARGDYETPESTARIVKYHCDKMAEKAKICDEFDAFINKIDKAAGSSLGEGDTVFYEKVKVTEYKKENVAVPCAEGSLKEGQCFVLQTGFTHGCVKGSVYIIHEQVYNGSVWYKANRMNDKLTKELGGKAIKNHWNSFGEKFFKYLETGAISWCTIETRKMPYEVEKTVKRVIPKQSAQKTEKACTESRTASSDGSTNKKNNNITFKDVSDSLSKDGYVEVPKYTYIIKRDVDTRDNSEIYLVTIKEKLTKEKYIELAKVIQSLNGYYSKFKHAFLFRYDPTDKLCIE